MKPIVGAIGPTEAQALLNQWFRYPEIPLVELVLQAGYVSEREMRSLQVTEYLLRSGKITTDQLKRDTVDQNETSYWWPKNFPPDDPFEPFDASPVPKRPYPSAGSGSDELPWP